MYDLNCFLISYFILITSFKIYQKHTHTNIHKYLQIGEQVCRVSYSAEDSLTTASWMPDSQAFIAAGTKGQFYLCVSRYVLLLAELIVGQGRGGGVSRICVGRL